MYYGRAHILIYKTAFLICLTISQVELSLFEEFDDRCLNLFCNTLSNCGTVSRFLSPRIELKVRVWFYIALYPVRWTAQSALHFHPLADLFTPTPFSASLGSILAMQQLRNDYSLTFPPLSIARYSFIQLSRLRRREVKENAQTSKR